MKSLLKALCLSSVLALLLAAPSAAEAERGLKDGEVLPPREIPLASGETAKVPDSEGVTVLVFWSTWSPRSEPALELWKALQADYSKDGLRVISINAEHQNLSDEDRRKVADYVTAKGVSLPLHVEGNLGIYNEIGVVVLPTAFFLKPDGTIAGRFSGFPSSAPEDLREMVQRQLGIYKEPVAKAAAEEKYQPKNNALMFFGMGKQLHQKGQKDKAQERYLEALKRDPDYPDPLRGLEGLFFADGRTAEAEGKLKELLTASGLEAVAGRIGQGEPLTFEGGGKSDMMEKMKKMMEGK